MRKITLLALVLSSLGGFAQQVKNYKFSQSSGTYTELTGGNVLGNDSSDAQFFLDPAVPLGSTSALVGPGLPIGFNFTFNGYVYDRFAVSTDGWISLGSSLLTANPVDCNVTSSFLPLSSVKALSTAPLSDKNLAAKIAALGIDLKATAGSSIKYQTIGTIEGQRVLVVQWKGFRKGGTIGAGDNFNFQIRLNEGSNTVDIVYGEFTVNTLNTSNVATAIPTAQVGLRAEPTAAVSNYLNRNSLSGWSNTVGSNAAATNTAGTESIVLYGTKAPANGLTFRWTPPAACAQNVSLYEDFDGYPGTFPMKGMPNCWSNALSTGGTNGESYITNTTPLIVGPNRLYMTGNASTSSAGVSYVVSPQLLNTEVAGTKKYRLRFKAYADKASANTFEVGYLTDNTSLSSYQLIQKLTFPATINALTEFKIEPTTLPANAYLVFKNPGFNANQVKVYIDDIVWEEIPLSADVSTLVKVGMETHNSVNFKWTKDASNTAWQYALGIGNNVNPNSLNAVDIATYTENGSEVSSSLSGLTPTTDYRIWVRSKTAGSVGAWIGPMTFMTQPAPVSQLVENFDGSANLSAGWIKIVSGTTTTFGVLSNTTAGVSAPNVLLLPAKSSTDYAVISLPPVNNPSAGGSRLRFKAATTAGVNGLKLEIGYLDASGAFVSLNTDVTVNSGAMQAIEKSLGTIPGTVLTLAFRNGGVPAGNIIIDDLYWEATPSTCPDVTALGTTSVTPTSAELNWTASGSGIESFQYALGDVNLIGTAYTAANPVNLTPVAMPASKKIENLNPASQYRIWVRSKCADGSFGAWAGPVNFTTPCASGTDFVQNFNSSFSIPSCWIKVSGSTTAISTITYADKTNALNLTALSATVPAIVALPGVSNVGSGQYRVKFDWGASATDAVLELGYLTNVSSPNSFTPLTKKDPVTNTDVPLTYTVTAIATESSVTVELPVFTESEILAFRNVKTSTAYLNNVTVEKMPTCEDVSNVAVSSVTNNTALIDWENPIGQDKWQYVIGDATLTNPNNIAPIVEVKDVSEKLIEGLSPETSYKIWVRSKCGEFNVGTWSAPVTIKTTCPPTNVITENFLVTPPDQKTLPTCWNRVGGGTQDVFVASYLGISKFSGASPVIAMPPISNTDANYVLKFDAGTDQAGSVLEVGYLKNILDANSFVTITSIVINSVTETQREVVTLTLPIKSNVIGFRNATPTNSWVKIDNILWGPADTVAPSCTNMTSIADANCGNYVNKIEWTAAQYADSYKLTIGTTPTGGEIVNEKTTTKLNYSFIGKAGTKYYYTVKPFNAVGVASECAVGSFTTNEVACYCKSVPSGKIGKGITDVQFGATNFKGGNDTYNNLTAKPVNFIKGEKANLKLTFDTRQTNGNGPKYATKVWVDFNDDFEFSASEALFKGDSQQTDEGPKTLDASFDIPAAAVNGLHRMRIVASPDVSKDNLDACFNGTGVTFEFAVNLIATPLANDNPSTALTALTVGKTFASNPVTGTNVNATGSVTETQPACGNYNGADVWYKAVVPASGELTFEVNTVTDGLTNTAVAAYKDTDTTEAITLELIGCDDLSSTAGDDQPKLTLKDRPVGETLYYRVWANGGDAYGAFKVSAYNDPTLGKDTFTMGNFAYYPNPVKDVLNISLDQEISNVTVFNLLGQKLIGKSANANQFKLDLSGLTRGNYLVKIETANGSKTVKIVKE